MLPESVQRHSILHAAYVTLAVSAVAIVVVTLLGFVVTPLVVASANNGGVSIPSCPIEGRENRTVIPLDPSQFLYGVGSESGPFLVTIPSGKYDITLASFDNHSEKGGQGQESERWQLKLLDSSGVLVGVTALIGDLADADDVRVEKVNTGFVISADVAKLRPFHPDEKNSIRPLCAAFDLILTGGTGTDTTSGTATTTATTTSSSGGGVNNMNNSSSGAGCGECGGIGGGGVTGTPFVVSEERAQWIGQAIVVTWKTNIPATSRVYYGTASVEPPLLDEHLGYATSTLLATTTATDHTVEIVGVDQTKTYYLRPASQETAEQNFRIAGKELRLMSRGYMPLVAGSSPTIGVETTPTVTNVTNVVVERSGALPTCGAYLTSFIRSGAVNNYTDVARLQLFLSQYDGFSDLRITGIYDETTKRAVETFQARYPADILIPWGLTSPTGFVYITTQKKVNELYCTRARGISAEFVLGPMAQEEISRYREALEAERRRMAASPTDAGIGSSPDRSASETSVEPSPTNAAPTPSVIPGFRVEPLESPVVSSGTPVGFEHVGEKRGALEGAALIVEKIGDRFATATRSGLIGALFAGFSGPSAPTFLGVLSLVLLIAGVLMLIRSLRPNRPDDSDQGNISLPPSPFGGSDSGSSQPRGLLSPTLRETQSGTSMPPPPVPPRTPPSQSMSNGPSSRVFQMPPASGTRVFGHGPGAWSGPQPVASQLRGNAGAATAHTPFGPGPMTTSADMTAQTGMAPAFERTSAARIIPPTPTPPPAQGSRPPPSR